MHQTVESLQMLIFSGSEFGWASISNYCLPASSLSCVQEKVSVPLSFLICFLEAFLLRYGIP